MLSKHSQKAFWAYKVSSKHISVWCQRMYLHCTIFWRPSTTLLKHFKSKCLYISVYLSFCFKDEARFYLVVRGAGGGWIISLRRLIKCFTIFHFNWNFSKFIYFFSISILSSIVLKPENFLDNLGFEGKIMVKFLIKSHFLSIICQ